MPVIRCSCCNRSVSQQLNIDMCTTCYESYRASADKEGKIKIIKKYLEMNPKSTAQKIANDLRISIVDINSYIDEGILMIVTGPNGEISIDPVAAAKEQRRKDLVQGLANSFSQDSQIKSNISQDRRSQLLVDLKNKFDREDK